MVTRIGGSYTATELKMGPAWAPSRVDRPRQIRTPTSSSRATYAIPVPGLARAIAVQFATERDEFEQAFELLTAQYRARGYEEPSARPFRFTPYHALPETLTVVAKEGPRVVATFSLVTDNKLLGLPMERLYGEEIAELRRAGRQLMETTCLADRGLATGEFLKVFWAMIRLGMQAHVRRGGDTWVMTVNPRHGAFYRRALGFRRLGLTRPHPGVQGAPAEAYGLEVETMRTEYPAVYRQVFEPLPDEALFSPPMDPDSIRYFGARSTQANRRAIEELIQAIDDDGQTRSRPRARARSGGAWARERVGPC